MSKYDKVMVYTIISLLCEVLCVAALIFDVGGWLRIVCIIGWVATILANIMSVMIVDYLYRENKSYREDLERLLL